MFEIIVNILQIFFIENKARINLVLARFEIKKPDQV